MTILYHFQGGKMLYEVASLFPAAQCQNNHTQTILFAILTISINLCVSIRLWLIG